MYDLIIRNGVILDGTGSDGYISDIGIKDGKIAEIGKNLEGEKVIDATGLTVTPGFIDSHSHSDGYVFSLPDMVDKVEQGITTAIGGQCGGSIAPKVNDVASYVDIEGMSADILKTAGAFFDATENFPQGVNLAMFIGHRNLRACTMGLDNRNPTPEELEDMKALLREGMEAGALGVTFGLIYPPSCFAETYELVELAKVVAEYDGVIAAHLRNEADGFEEAVEEFLYVMRQSGARCVLSHHKAAYPQNHGKVKKTLAMVDKANADGFDVHVDVYPYPASSTTLSARFIPKEYFSGGNDKLAERLGDEKCRKEITDYIIKTFGADNKFDWVLIIDGEYRGKYISEIACITGKTVYDTIMDLVKDSVNSMRCCYFMMCEEDVEMVLSHPMAMVGTDGVGYGKGKIFHPRAVASFPRVLGKYVRERKVATLPEMIRRITSMPAEVYGLKTKGLLKEGYDADICIFDADKIIDKADYVNCEARAEGLNYVIVNGKIAVKDATATGVKAGRIIRATLK